jgi:hypothetical protein
MDAQLPVPADPERSLHQMADTIQIVQWTLEMRCQLRHDEEAMICPGAATSAVSSARAYSKALRERRHGFGIYGNIYVSSYTFATCPGGRKAADSPYYPVSGFVISKEFESYGGTDGLRQMCSRCPANAQPQELARCVGTVPQWPDSPDTEEQLNRIINRLGLESAMANAFPATTPRWYGLWAVSPIPHASLGLLKTLLSEMLDEDREELESQNQRGQDQIDEFRATLSAIDIAITERLNLHVRLLPLGHTDFGIYTVFPHCPFCKALAKVARWQREYPINHHVCHVCGTKFSPQETASSERMDWDRIELRDLLGQAQFEDFAKAYLIANGESPNAAAAIVQESEAAELRRQEQARHNQELERLRQRFLEQHVFAGLDCLPAPAGNLDDEDACRDEGCSGWFSADNLAVVLQRCKKHGVRISMMQHSSATPDLDRFEMRNLKSPQDVLSKWVGEGCNERFHVVCRVPDSLVT